MNTRPVGSVPTAAAPRGTHPMPTNAHPTSPRDFVRRITRLLERGEREPYALPPHAMVRVKGWLEEAATAPNAAEQLGAVLKLIAVLRTKHRSPGAADTLTRAVTGSRRAMRVVALKWSGGRRRPRFGADLQPIQTTLAPHVDAKPTSDAVRVGSLLRPGQDLRGSHLANKIMRRKS